MPKLSKQQIKEIAKEFPLGFTIDQYGKHYERNGYAVALRPLVSLPPQTKFIGGWKNQDDYYLDEVEIFRSLGHALRTAIKHNQKAIWDFNFQREIVITDVHREFYASVVKGNAKAPTKEEQIRAIRKAYSEGITQKELAEKYQMGRSTVSDIVNYRTWKGVI